MKRKKNIFYKNILKILLYIILLFLIFYLSKINLIAEPILSFNKIQSYKLNSIKCSNLNFYNTAVFKVFSLTFDKKKELIFYAKIDYFIENFVCYFYCHPDFAMIEVLVQLDSNEQYYYEYKVNPNKEAEKDFIKYNFNEKYFYEIDNSSLSKTYYKVLKEYNPNYYSLISKTLLHYYDKKEVDINSIILFIILSIILILLYMIIAEKKIIIFTILFFILLFSLYVIFYNNQNFILKGYIKNPVIEKDNEYENVDNENLLNIPIEVEINEENEYQKIFSFPLIKNKNRSIKVYQQEYCMLFIKIFSQNSKFNLLENIAEYNYFISLPEIFTIYYENYQYLVKLNKILLFGRIKDEKEK